MMLTRSSSYLYPSSSSGSGLSSSNAMRKSMPSACSASITTTEVLTTRSRKRKSNVLQEEDYHRSRQQHHHSLMEEDEYQHRNLKKELRSNSSRPSSRTSFAGVGLGPAEDCDEGSSYNRRHSLRRRSFHHQPHRSGASSQVSNSSSIVSQRGRGSSLGMDEEENDRSSGSSTCSTSTAASSTTARRRSMRMKKAQYHNNPNSDAESLLSSLSIDDSLSGRSTPPRSRVSVNSLQNGGVPAKYGHGLNIGAEGERPSPLPPVTFGDHQQIWNMMCQTDCNYKKDANLFRNHPVLTPQMRSILLDWIMDVCEAYHLHRETLYLAIDYLDRYLATQNNVLKNHLQLIGITCLFIAAKMEEIYPPKLQTFAYVTDGACSEAEILDMELVVTKSLKWKLTPMTPCNWVNVYLQILSILARKSYHTRSTSEAIRSFRDNKDSGRMSQVGGSSGGESDNALTKVRYSGVEFVRAMRIIDLTMLDVHSLQYHSSLLAASAIYHTKGKTAASLASGFSWEQIAACAHWMAPFATAVRREDVPDVLPIIEGVSDEMRHLIHSHCVSLDLLEKAHLLASTNKVSSPLTHSNGIVTPPRSGEKQHHHRRRK